MAIVKSQSIKAQQDNLTLRDAQHAHKFFTSNSFQFAPKQKYLYHVVFTLTPYARTTALNTNEFTKQLSMLVKSADLPSYTADIETKKQYNRNKNIQTGIKYDGVSIRFHDDNINISSKLFEEYYNYYFIDGEKSAQGDEGNKIDFDARDLYSARVPRYGLKSSNQPFFESIKIFQMSRQRWRAYTLINPLVERWQHDAVDAQDASGMMENTMSVIYEGVLYSEGDVSIESNPAGFGSQETLYDTTSSPLGTNSDYPGLNETPSIPGRQIPPPERPIRFNNSGSIFFDNPFVASPREPGGFPNTTFPNRQRQTATSRLGNQNAVSNIESSAITRALSQDASALNSFVNRAVMSGNVSGFNVNNFSDFANLAPNTRNAITDELLGSITGGDRKLQQIASQAIKRALR